VYHNGRSRDLQTKGAEFEFQLDGQYQVLAQMPAKDYLAARDLFRQQGRQGNEATRQARKELQNKLFDYRLSLEDSPSRTQARAWAREAMRQVAILHNPDQVLGGNLKPSRDAGGTPIPGDRGVNSSLGAQNLSNAALIEAAAERQAAAGKGHLPLSFQVVLTNRRRNVKQLRAQQPPPPLAIQPRTEHDSRAPAQTLSKAVLAARPPPSTNTNPTTAARIRQTLGINTPRNTPPHRNRPNTTNTNGPER
ncbi:polymorphic toxin type 15 domain-containing protein, partial [Actinomyces sp. 565]|uniref:polymorphic toxin type 15 domain-containing protein n=1 Tax=Actinomyces sp. 565 TaxID=2057794 RepID=UPI0019394CEF